MSGPNDFTNQNIQDTYERVLQISSSNAVTDGTGSLVPILQATSSNAVSASFATTASYVDSTTLDTFKQTGTRTGDSTIDGALTVTGNIRSDKDIIAQRYIVSSSVTHLTQSFSSGSTLFGDTLNDTHFFSGSITGSSDISASGEIGGTGGRFGDAASGVSLFVGPGTGLAAGTNFVGHTSYPMQLNGSVISTNTLAPTSFIIRGNVTASKDVITGVGGHISASGNIIANNATFDGPITAPELTPKAQTTATLKIGNQDNSHPLTNHTIQIGFSPVSGPDPSKAAPLIINSNITASGNISSSGTIITDKFKANLEAGVDNSVLIKDADGFIKTDEIDSRVWGSTLLDNNDTAACATQVKTVECTADLERYITFVDDNNGVLDCETLKTNPALRWNCRRRTLIVDGAIKSKGSDVTIMSGSISMSGDLIITGSISSSGAQTNLTITTGSFNHIITDGDTIEFRNASTGVKEGRLKFDSSAGLSVKTADDSGHTNLAAHEITAKGKFISDGSAEFQGDVTMSGHFSASGKMLCQDLTTSDSGQVITPKIASGDTGNIIIDAASDITLDAAGDQIYFKDNGSSRFTFNVDATPELDINGNFILDGSGTVKIDAATSILLDAGTDITLDAGGDQIYLKDGGTTRFTFNLDSTPQIDIAGDLILNPSGGDVKVSGALSSYGVELWPNYAIGGSQGYSNILIIPYTEFVHDTYSGLSYKAVGGYVNAGADGVVSFTRVIPKGYLIEAALVIDGGFGRTVTISSTAAAGLCSPVELATITTVKCPKVDDGGTVEEAYAGSATLLHPSVQSKLAGNDLNVAIFRIDVIKKDVLFGAVLFMRPMS